MKTRKRYIVLLIILVIFSISMYFLVAKKNIRESKEKTELIVGTTSIWRYQDRKWSNVSYKNSIDSMNWETFDLYEDNEFKGKYQAWYDGQKWYYFDKDRNSIIPENRSIAFKSNFEIQIKPYEEKQIETKDIKYINSVLEDNNLSTSSKFTSNYKVELDYDSDGEEETFIIITNAFPMDFNPDEIFSIVFMVKNNDIYYIYKSKEENRTNNGCKPYFNHFLDLTNDGIDELILSCGKYSENGTVDMLYHQEDNEFKILISNQ